MEHHRVGFEAIRRAQRPILAGLLLAAVVGCAGSEPDPFAVTEVAPAEELYASGVAILENPRHFLGFDFTKYKKAIDSFQDIIDNYPYSDYAVMAELRIADAFYEQEHWDEASSYYRDFAELHPDHEKVPYALFRGAMCQVNQSRDPKRDQTATKKALEQLDDLMARYPYAPESREAEGIWRDLRTNLGRHVLGIGDYYAANEEWQSAAGRYRSVLNEFPGLGLDAEALYKLGLCYSKMNREDEANRIFEVILENYQGSEIADAAQELVPAAN